MFKKLITLLMIVALTWVVVDKQSDYNQTRYIVENELGERRFIIGRWRRSLIIVGDEVELIERGWMGGEPLIKRIKKY